MADRSANSALAGTYDARAATYRVFGNGSLVDVVRAVLPQGGSVLDVGCASGGLLAQLAGQAGRRVGIEISEAAAVEARAVADEVVVGDIADPVLLAGGERFDVVVLADVIEHTTDSSAALQQALRFCADGGAVVVSVPNIAHWSARLNLARGRWDYAESGLMDRGHLRFFTPRTILAEMDAAGVQVETVSPVVPRLRNHLRSLRRLPRPVQARVEQGWQTLGRRRPALMAYQLIIVGRVRRG